MSTGPDCFGESGLRLPCYPSLWDHSFGSGIEWGEGGKVKGRALVTRLAVHQGMGTCIALTSRIGHMASAVVPPSKAQNL